MLKYFVAYFATAAAFLVIDLFWLGLVAKEFYRCNIGTLMADQINVAAAVQVRNFLILHTPFLLNAGTFR